MRYDSFDVTQNEQTPEDDNQENGHSWTLGYKYGMTEHMTIAAEWLGIETQRSA